MMKINVYSEKSGNFGAESKMKPMIIIESKKKPLEPGKKDKNGKPILSLKEKYPDAMIIDVTSKAPSIPLVVFLFRLLKAWWQYLSRASGKV